MSLLVCTVHDSIHMWMCLDLDAFGQPCLFKHMCVMRSSWSCHLKSVLLTIQQQIDTREEASVVRAQLLLISYQTVAVNYSVTIVGSIFCGSGT